MNRRKETIKQFLKFTLFSCSAGLIQVISFTLLNEFANFRYWPAYLISLILSIVWNFTLNREFTFKSAANVPAAMTKVFAYYAVFTPVTSILGDYFAEGVGVNEYIVLAVTMILNFVTEFLFDKFVVFRGQVNTNKRHLKRMEKKSTTCQYKGDENISA